MPPICRRIPIRSQAGYRRTEGVPAGNKTGGYALALLLAGCDGPLSTLSPGGPAATQIAGLFLVMLAVACGVWLLVMALAVYAARARPNESRTRQGHLLIIGGGIVLPVLLLGTLTGVGLTYTNTQLEPGEDLVIDVAGERWWWRVEYRVPGQEPVVAANEIRLPLGERVAFRLHSANVIHSFWIPSLGGKIDMIPGRVNSLVLEADREGRYRGACAEYCGISHTLMEFDVLVVSRAEFDLWLARQARAAEPPAEALAAQGGELFLQNGCGACHTIRGTAAKGRTGPDLTHVGSRATIAAGTLPTHVSSFAAWIAHPQDIKPGALMPAYRGLDASQLVAIGTYLESLR